MSEHEPEHAEQESQVEETSELDPEEAAGPVSPDEAEAEDPAEDDHRAR